MSAEAPPRTDRLEVVHEAKSPSTSWLAGARRAASSLRPPLAAAPMSPGRAVVVWLGACVSGLCVWLLLYAFVLSGLQQSRSQDVLYDELRQGLAEATTPFGGVIPPGTPVLLLDAPAGGLHHQVGVEGTASGDLMKGPGHLANTVMPGQEGASVLLGRSVMFGGPFGDITRFTAGDRIVVTTGQGQFTFVVDRVRHPGDPLPAPAAAGSARLILVSSTGPGSRARWAPQGTVYVDATLKPGGDPSSKAQLSPPGRAGAVPVEQRVMRGDSRALLPLMLWLQLLVGVVVLLAWGRARWGTWQTWLVGLPLALAALWGSTQALVGLLPNLL